MPTVSTASTRTHVLEVIGNSIIGGMEISVSRLIERLPSERFRISVLCPFESPYTDRLRALGADVFTTPMPDDASWGSIQVASALVRARGVDVIHSHLSNAHLLAGLAGRLAGKPVLASVHGRNMTSLDMEVHRVAATHLHVVCRQSYFHALGIGAEPARLHFIPNGVDTVVFAPRARGATPLRDRFKVPERAKLIGFVGRLSPEKGPDVFLAMALAVHQANPTARFVVVGDGPMLAALKGFTARAGLGNAVHFTGVQDDMPSVMAELDVLVSTSHSEAMPLALMEAMASGLPVVATRVGGVPDLVQHGATGWLTHGGDPEGLATHVLALLRDDALGERAGALARARAVEHFPLADTVAQTAELLTRLAHGAAEPARIAAVANTGKRLGGVGNGPVDATRDPVVHGTNGSAQGGLRTAGSEAGPLAAQA